ncbi:MAG: hypothetical protein JJ902_21755 [Roseibium sp.]|nr:hypothetical protein [Roseibium sp.]
MNEDTIHAHIIARTGWGPTGPGARQWFLSRRIAAALAELSRRMPGTRSLLLGGSFARGEPCMPLMGDDVRCLSDFDFVLVGDKETPLPPLREFLHDHADLFCNVSCYAITQEEYLRLETGVGHDLKTDGLLIGGPAPPQAKPVRLTFRDASDLLTFCAIEILESGVFEVPERELDRPERQYLIHRFFSYPLRSFLLLDGACGLADTARLGGQLGDLPSRNIAWRFGKTADFPLVRKNIMQALAFALAEHRMRGYLAVEADTISGSSLAQDAEAQQAIAVQQFALSLIDALIAKVDVTPDQRLPEVLNTLWRDCRGRAPAVGGAPGPSAADWFGAVAPWYRTVLFRMKTAVQA